MLPRTKSWEQIGRALGVDFSGIPDTNPEIELGVARFERLTAEEQIRILGPAKYAAWKDGLFSLKDLAGRKADPVWGETRVERSLKGLVGVEAAKGYTRLSLMGIAKNAGNYSADDLIRIAGLGLSNLTSAELDRVIRHVAVAGFDPDGRER